MRGDEQAALERVVDRLAPYLFESRGEHASFTRWEDAGPTCRAFYRRLARASVKFWEEERTQPAEE